MPYTIIPLGNQGQQNQPIQVGYGPVPGQTSAITQQPSQYPMVIDLSRVYNDSVYPPQLNQPTSNQFNKLSSNQFGQPTPNQFGQPTPNQFGQPIPNQFGPTTPIFDPNQQGTLGPNMTTYKPTRSTGCCEGKDDYGYDDGGSMKGNGCCGDGCCDEGGCDDGCCGGGSGGSGGCCPGCCDDEEIMDNYAGVRGRRGARNVGGMDGPERMGNMAGVSSPRAMNVGQNWNQQRPRFIAAPSSNVIPVQITSPTVIPIAYPQGNVRVLGGTGQPMWGGAIDKGFNYSASSVQPTRYVMG